MSMRWYYTYAGLRVASALSIPEWDVFLQKEPFCNADVSILLDGPSEQNVKEPSRESLSKSPFTPPTTTKYITADEFRFCIPEIGSYWIRKGSEIIITPDPGAGEREVRLYLLGSAWGAICYQRGLLALHASVVQIDNQAMAFCGPSGSGKSSMAACLVDRGYCMIADDLCRFELTRDEVCVHPSAPRLKLWKDALMELKWSRRELIRDHFRADKFHKNLAYTENMAGPYRLCAVYLLGWGEPGIKSLKGFSALRSVIESATYRGDMLEPMGCLAEHWQRCAELVQRVPVFLCTRPRDWSKMNEIMDLWLTHQSNLSTGNNHGKTEPEQILKKFF